MPVSASQHRASAGAYQNKLHDNFIKSPKKQAQTTNPDSSGIPEEIHHFVRRINGTVNSPDVLAMLSNQTTVPKQSLAVTLLMLLSQVRFDCISPSSTSDIATLPQKTLYSDNSGAGLSTVIDTVVDSLYKVDRFIVRNDPLRFPGASASALPATDNYIMHEIQDDSINGVLFHELTGRDILNISDETPTKPFILFTPVIEGPARSKREDIRKSQEAQNTAYEKYINRNCLIRTKTNQGKVLGDSLLVSGEMIRNPIRAAAEKAYKEGMGGHDMPDWLVNFTEFANIGYDVVLGYFTRGIYPIVKYASAKAMSASGHAVNGDVTCLKREFSPEELTNLLFNTEAGLTDRHLFLSFSTHPIPTELKNARSFVPDGVFVHENTANRLNTVKYMTINHHNSVYYIREKAPGEYWTFHPTAVKPELVEKRVYFDSINNKIHFNNEMPEGQGLDYNISEGKSFISLYGENHEITWNWDNKQPEIILHKKNGETLIVPVYMEPLSKTWHLSTHNEHPVFNKNQVDIIKRIRVEKEEEFNYIPRGNNNQNYYGNGNIYAKEELGDSGHYPRGQYIEMNGDLVPVKTITTQGHGVHYEVHDLNNPTGESYPIEWDGNRWIFERKTSNHVSKSLKKIISSEIISNEFNSKKFSAPDRQGLMYDADGGKYIKAEDKYIRLSGDKKDYFITKTNNENIHLQIRNGKFHQESFQHKIHRLNKNEPNGKNQKPYQIISKSLNMSEDEAIQLINKYAFDKESNLYTENTLALEIKESGKIPSWAKNFEKLEFGSYVSHFKNDAPIENGLIKFSGSDNYFYRVDSNPPEIVLQSGFRTSDDYTAIEKMIPENKAGVIVSGSLQGALRYNNLAKSKYIYKIKGDNVRGVSLQENLMKNQDKVKSFLGEPLEKKYETLESFAKDCNGAIYLDEIHLYKEDIKVEDISILSQDEMKTGLEEGPWKNYI